MNAPTHKLVAGTIVGIFIADREAKDGQSTLKPFVGGAAAALFTNLPDMLEPATSPNHRGLGHSLTLAALLGLGLHHLSQWQPETEAEKFWKGLGMIAGSAYLIHLAQDFTTPKSLPFIGHT